MKRIAFLTGALVALFGAGSASASEAQPRPPQMAWTFSGPFGTFDRDQLQRGLKIYQESCHTCHSMKYLAFRSLSEPGGPELTEKAMEALAAGYTITGETNDKGEPMERAGRPADRFPPPFPNEKAAAEANGGKAPPDLSLMAKARTYERGFPYFITDIFTQYSENGPDYIHALLTGYETPPEGFTGVGYNKYFPGHAIAMPQPISDDQFEYPKGADGKPVVPQTIDQYAKDVTAFLVWASDPHMEARKKMGLNVILYLMLLTGLLYLTKSKLWRRAYDDARKLA